ncbi:MAG: PD-(D/E)XK nuclease family protein [Porticoccaceae bacterium]|nr:PD-(D/E)XK nuclease family protein [Porticoccaceae bacterium]
MTPLFDITPLQYALAQGQFILTPNQRLARAIQQAWGLNWCQQGKKTWDPAPVYAIDHWLASCWQDLRDATFEPALIGTLAPEHTELFLWSQIIAADERTPTQGSIIGFARLARQARQYLELWQVGDTDTKQTESWLADHQGYQLLQRWLPQFRSAMTAAQLLTQEQILDFIEQGFVTATLPKSDAIHLVGFQNLPPKQRQLLETAADTLVEVTPASQSSHCQIAVLADGDIEISRAAQWARKQLENQPQQCHPQQRIGIVFPDLTRIRDRVERQFRSILQPEYCLPGTANTPPPFNMSAGIPLAQTPLIQAALKLLALHEPSQSLSFYCAVLNNPFWGDSYSEIELRSEAEVRLRDLNQITLKPGDFRFVVKRAQDNTQENAHEGAEPANTGTTDTSTDTDLALNTNKPELSARLQRAADQARRHPKKQTFSAWASALTEQLEVLGWPGSRTLDSIEYQQLQHWRQVLDQLTELDASNTQVTWPEALNQLRQLLSKAIFQAQAPDSPVQILGVLEAAGLRFDALWVAGMSDEHWPQPVQMHPLLPASLQKHAAMPRTSAERELALARELISGFAAAATQVIFSYTERDGDVEKRPSPLLQEVLTNTPLHIFDDVPCDEIPAMLDHPLAKHLADHPNREWLEWEQAPVFDHRSEIVRGGSGLLRDQAACPFNAFVRWRLDAKPLNEPGPGLSALERGNLVHRGLEIFWRQTKTQAELLALSEEEKGQRLELAITTALDETARYRPELNGIRLRRIESVRLHKLLQRWLVVESQRAAFSVMVSEHDLSLQLGGGNTHSPLQLPLRIDRIDRLADGRLLLMDYKTGKADTAVWAGPRPEQPQLPLYAVALTDDTSTLPLTPTDSEAASIAVLCFAQISSTRGIALKGITDDEDNTGFSSLQKLDLPDTWNATIDHWRESLGGLAEEFIEGDAEIVYYTAAAKYQGHLTPINRLAELDDIQALHEADNSGAKP